MKKKNTKFITFADEKGPWIIGIGGLLLTAYCAWFQTMGFHYLSVTECLTAAGIGLAVAYFFMMYIYKLTKPNEEAPQKVMKPEALARMMRNVIVMFLIVSVFTFVANSAPAFLVGLGAMAYGAGSMIMYLVIKTLLKKRQEK